MLFNLKQEKSLIFTNQSINLSLGEFISNKVNILIEKEIELVSSFVLLSSNFYSGSLKNPDESYTLVLEKGEYILTTNDEALIFNNNKNTLLKSSKGIVTFDENNFYHFKIAKNKIFNIWFTSQDIKSIKFNVYKIISTYDENDYNLISSFIISEVNVNLNLQTNYLYKFEFYQFNNTINEEIIKKYPSGTFQVSINEIINLDNKNIDKVILNDISKFDVTSDGKINSLSKIIIPQEVNPINYYSMVAHYEITVIIDYNTDNIMVYQNSFLESFLSLYIPDSTYEVIEHSDTYSLLKVKVYEFIAESYDNFNQIKNGLKNLAEFSDEDLHQDEYGLYYWINDFSIVSHNQIEKIKNFIKDQFYYLNLSIRGFVTDDLTIKYEKDDDLLNTFTFESCIYKVSKTTNKINFNYNHITWNELPSPKQNAVTNWYNESDSENATNILKLSLLGTAIIRISKQKFKAIFNIDLDEANKNTDYSLTQEQFELLKLNKPIIYPFERLQNWFAIKDI